MSLGPDPSCPGCLDVPKLTIEAARAKNFHIDVDDEPPYEEVFIMCPMCGRHVETIDDHPLCK